MRTTLNILGCVPGMLNIIMELAEQALEISDFNILNNMDSEIGDKLKPIDHWNIKFYDTHKNKWPDSRLDKYALSVVGTDSKPKVYEYFAKRLGIEKGQLVKLIHPSSVISTSAEIEDGAIIEALTVISACTIIGFANTIKRNCSIGHHCILGDYVTINPGVTVSGNVTIGNNTLIGSGAVIRDFVSIGSNTLIGAGSVVVKDIPDNSIAFGNPCKVVKEK